MKRSIEGLERLLCRIGALLLLPLLLVTVFDVTSRFLFKNPLPGAIELCSFLLLVFALSGLSIAEARKEHLRISFIRDRMKGRIGYTFDLVANGWGVFVSLLLAFQGFRNMLLDKTVTEMLRIPYKPFWSFLGFTCLLLSMRFLNRIVRRSDGYDGTS